jgi:multidrug efflux system membrane fusion protein
MRGHPFIASLFAGLVIVVIGLAYWVLAPRFATRTAPPVAAVPVVAVPAMMRDLPIWLSAIGTVQSLNVVSVRPRVEGELQKVEFVEGQEVRAGDLLAQIDPRPFDAARKQAAANLQKDEAQLAHARSELTRYIALAEKGFVSAQNVDAFRVQVSSLEATVRSDQAMLETATLQLGFTRIVAPIAGRVGFRQADPGSMVRASDPNGLLVITQVRPITVLFAVPQDALHEIVAERAKGKLGAIVYSRDGLTQLADGEVASIDNQVDAATGQIKMKAIFANANGALWPGELASIRILLRTERDAVVVPSQAVLSGIRGNYVYVVKADNTVEARPVQVGATVDVLTALRSGIANGERVVSEGQSRLAPGTKVEVKRESGPSTTGAAS